LSHELRLSRSNEKSNKYIWLRIRPERQHDERRHNTITYDGEGRAVTATNGGSLGAYTYDGNGLRVKKVAGSTTTVYVFSGAKVIAEYANGAAPSAPTREYIYAGGALLARIDSTGTKYYHQDHLSNRMVTNSTGGVAAEMAHFPFGESWYNATNDKLLFTIYERDAESGNDYAMARYVRRHERIWEHLGTKPVIE
jgi:YD repeat-containing protein